MIDTIINLFIIVGVVVVSVPVLMFALVGVIHMAYGAYKMMTNG